MSLFKFSVLTLIFYVVFSPLQAKQWDDAALERAKKDAIVQINLFINQKQESDIYRLLSWKKRNVLRRKLSFQNYTKPSFHYIKKPENALSYLAKSTWGESKIAYAALLLEYTSKPQDYNENALSLYGAIIESSDESAVRAFRELDLLDLSNQPSLSQMREKIHSRYGFDLNDIDVDRDQRKPEVCLQFSHMVRPQSEQDWQQRIHVSPKPRSEWRYQGDSVCFNGEWQTRYQIEIDQSLQNKYHLSLRQKKLQSVFTGAREPSIRFASNGSVLNAEGERHIAIATANIDEVEVELWRIPANSLSNEDVQRIIETPANIGEWRLKRNLKQEGQKLFQGAFTVSDATANATIYTNVFLHDMVDTKDLQAGIYLMVARSTNENNQQNTQIAFSLSNTGFSAYLSDEGLWAEMRDLTNSSPVANQTVTLYAKNNSVLGTAVTNRLGLAYFPKSMINGEYGMRPNHIINQDGAYFSYLDISNKPVDLSNKGLSGTLNNAVLNSWVWSDRGVYRPKDTAHVMWLLKTKQGKAFARTPVWIELQRSDGKVILEKSIAADTSGAYNFHYYFDNRVRQGDWHLRIFLGKKGKLIAEKKLPVHAITPQQIESWIEPIKQPLTQESQTEISLHADWLYGAPAVNLPASLSHSIIENPQRFSAWRDWQIGLHDSEFFAQQAFTDELETDQDGLARFKVALSQFPFSTKPLALALKGEVFEPSGKRITSRARAELVRTQPYLAVQAGTEKSVNVALLNQQGQLQAGRAQWKLFRVHYHYYWYKKNGKWQYQHNESRQLVEQGALALNAEKTRRVSLPLEDGQWVFVVQGEGAQTAASIAMNQGYYAAPGKDNSPDRIDIASDKTRYRHGETVTLQLRAPFDGKASVKFAFNDRIVEQKTAQFTKGKASLRFKWNAKWNQGLWLLANGWNQQQSDPHNRRAIGLHWLGGDLSDYALDLNLDLPERILPNRTLKIPVSVPATQIGQTTWVRVAAVDDGLYQLAKASFSNPLDTFWGKKQLNLDFFDAWGNIITPVKARQAAIRSGAGADLEEISVMTGARIARPLPEVDIDLLAFWSKPVKFDSNGKAYVELELPQFNGRLRIMAAAWSQTRLGAAQDTVQVREPLVSTLYTPAYLSPGDTGQLRLRMHNTTEKSMEISAQLLSPSLNLNQQAGDDFKLAPDQVLWLNRDFFVTDDVKGRVTVDAHIRGSQSVDIDRFMDVRPSAYPLLQQKFRILESGASYAFKPSASGNLLARQLHISSKVPFNVQNVLEQLSVYPYGCAEQLTSKAWSNLLLDKLITRYDLPIKKWGSSSEREGKLFSAQNRLANYQGYYGDFSLWGGGESSLWLSAYITEFLLEAQNAKKLATPLVLANALTLLQKSIHYRDNGRQTQAYTYYVLAKAGAATLGATVRYAEAGLNEQAKLKLSSANIHIAAALVWHGELDLATRWMQSLNAQPLKKSHFKVYGNYGTALRNYAQSLTVLYQMQAKLNALGAEKPLQEASKTAIERLWPAMVQAMETRRYYSTQELLWMSALASVLPDSKKKSNVLINNKQHIVEVETWFKLNLHEAIEIKNTDSQPVYLNVSDLVLPAKDSVTENGYRIQMHYEDERGQPVDIRKLKLRQEVFAIAKIIVDKSQDAGEAMFVYPLPAGLKSMPFNGDSPKRPWNDSLKEPQFSEQRDDRHLAAFKYNGNGAFFHVFKLQATQKGQWHAPAYSIENMYQPQFRTAYPMPAVMVE